MANNVGWGQSGSPVKSGVPEYLILVSSEVHVNPTQGIHLLPESVVVDVTLPSSSVVVTDP